MKKIAIIGGIVLVVALWVGFEVVSNKILGMVTNYEPYTFERVLEDEAMAEDYGIGSAKDPGDYGFTDFSEVSFKSYLDGLLLSSWYISSAKQSKKTVLLLHGRTSNRLKAMKYLEIFKASGLDTLYNFFIPDLRNSGRSSTAPTYMGYKFAEDIRGALHYLKNAQDQDSFVLYGFSMGAMAISVVLDREDLTSDQVIIEKVILDSPLANSKENLRGRSKDMGVPNFLFESVYRKFSGEIEGYGEQLNFRKTLKYAQMPVFIVQSNDDLATPADQTRAELSFLEDKDNIRAWFVDGPDHVDIYRYPDLSKAYADSIVSFLQ